MPIWLTHFSDGDVAALVSPSQLEDFSERDCRSSRLLLHTIVWRINSVRIRSAVPDIRRDRIPRHLLLQSNASQGHEDMPGCVQPGAPHLHVEPEMEVAAHGVRNEPL